MTYEQWEEKYKPITNQIVSAPIDGYMFETYGEEFEYVQEQSTYRLWTVVEGEEHMWLSMGFHVVNRLGYILTEVPWTDEEFKQWEDIKL